MTTGVATKCCHAEHGDSSFMQQRDIFSIPLGSIRVNAEGMVNSRTSFPHVEELKNSILKDGLLTPLIVAEGSESWDFEGYVLLAGESRLRAINSIREDWFSENPEVDSDEAPFSEINCTVYCGDFDGASVISLIDNLKRQDLNPADEAEAIFKLVSQLGNQQAAADRLGISQPSVSNKFNLKRNLISEVFEALRSNLIKLSAAKKISKLLNEDKTPNQEAQLKVLEELLDDGNSDVSVEGPARVKTYRSKKEVEELRTLCATAIDIREEVDVEHRKSLHQFLRWYFREIDTDEMLFRVDELNLSDYEEEDSDEEVDDETYESEAPTKKRIRVGE